MARIAGTAYDPWHYVCPFCGASNGRTCLTRSGKARTSHAQRKGLALDAQYLAAVNTASKER